MGTLTAPFASYRSRSFVPLASRWLFPGLSQGFGEEPGVEPHPARSHRFEAGPDPRDEPEPLGAEQDADASCDAKPEGPSDEPASLFVDRDERDAPFEGEPEYRSLSRIEMCSDERRQGPCQGDDLGTGEGSPEAVFCARLSTAEDFAQDHVGHEDRGVELDQEMAGLTRLKGEEGPGVYDDRLTRRGHTSRRQPCRVRRDRVRQPLRDEGSGET